MTLPALGEKMTLSFRLAALCGLTLCLFFSTSAVAQDTDLIIRRAAFDIGSAAIKCTIADVDITTGRIIKTIDRLSTKINFAEDIARSYDGNFSKKIQREGIKALNKMKLKAIELHATEFSAIGGAATRTAQNGRAYFVHIKKETGIPCRIISVQQGALLSYHAVRQQLDISSRNLLVWDIGGGSMQITARQPDGSLIFYIDTMSSISFKNIVINIIQDKDANIISSPNPMNEIEVEHALHYVQSYAQMHIPQLIKSKIKNSEIGIVGIGGVHYYSIPETIGKRRNSYSRDEVEKALKEWTNKPDEAFKTEYSKTRLTNLILVLGYMKALNINTIYPLKINEADGLLAVPEFW
jgi:exopolyphosphatase/guanosine-5'-triphosphate,3'-diphosphate pyrophosphatase